MAAKAPKSIAVVSQKAHFAAFGAPPKPFGKIEILVRGEVGSPQPHDFIAR
jgi:hypothetical protein